MRSIATVALAVAVLSAAARAEEPPRLASKVVLKSPDGKKSYDLAKLTAGGPVLVRLTCACSGCDQELPFFQKLQAAYGSRGLQTLAVFQEKPDVARDYVAKKDLRFLWLADPKRQAWTTFHATTMPTNILLAKGGRVVSVLPGCTRDGRNAQALSAELGKLLKTKEVQVAERKPRPKE
ncbi:MAG TPA: TlpA disulfide reductase family protein [Gemmataceae bacterium]|jgi:peroxiredoxin|nr:TlpA disulfide reductase family protein [Gemmataceae bacterium]